MSRHAPPARLSWPWRESCAASLHVGGDVFLEAITTALTQARKSIVIELYLCSSGTLFEEWLGVLAQAVDRGVQVRVLLDDVGSHQLAKEDRQRLADSGVALRWFNPLRFGHPVNALIRDHRKLIIIDAEQAWTGGMGLDDNYSPRLCGDDAWSDLMVRCEGAIVADWLALFEQAWALAGEGSIRGALRWRLHWHVRHTDDHPTENECVRLVAARGGQHNPLMRTLVRRIRQARDDIWLCTPYFLPPRSLHRALKQAARRGVRVHLLVSGPCTDHQIIRFAGQHLYSRLLRAGVHIHEFQACFIHLKAARVDDWCTLGSFNYDRWNSSWNLEANAEWQHSALCQQLDALRQQLEQQSHRIQPDSWRQRGSLARLRESLMFWVGTRLVRLLHALR